MKVQSVWDMTDDEFLLHAELRHPNLRFVTRHEHDALHRIQLTSLHVHLARVAEKSGGQLSSARGAK